MQIKRLLSGLLASFFLLPGIAGCSSAPPAGPSSQTGAASTVRQTEAPYELSVAWWGGEARHKKTLEMIDAYMDSFPHAKIISQYAAYGDYWTKIATQAASQNMPDVYLVQLTYLGEYASKGLMRPLQDLVDSGRLDVSSFTPGALSSSSYNGELVGITFGDTASCIAYNKTLIESVNHPLPTDQMTYGEYADYLKELAKKLPKGYYASGLDAHHEASIEIFTRQNGLYGVTSEDGGSLGYTKEVLTKFLSYYLDLYKAGVNPSIEVLLEDRSKQFGDSLAGNGRIAAWFTNANQVKIFQSSVDDELGMVRCAVVDDAARKNVEAAVCSTWAISGRTQRVDESAHFISSMVNTWELQEIYDMDIGVPGSVVIQQRLIDKLDVSNKVDAMKKREIELMQDILNTIEPFNGRPSGYGAVVDDLYKKIDEVLYGSLTVEQAVETHFAAANALLQ